MIDLDHTLVKAMETKIYQGFAQYRIPDHIQDGIEAYILDGRETGDFLTAVFADSFVGAYCRADGANLVAMRDIAAFLYQVAPMDCRGSRENVEKWIAHDGLRGLVNPWCFWIDQTQDYEKMGGYIPSRVVAGVRGHRPMTGDRSKLQAPWIWGPTLQDALKACDQANIERGVSPEQAALIVASSMAVRR